MCYCSSLLLELTISGAAQCALRICAQEYIVHSEDYFVTTLKEHLSKHLFKPRVG